MRCCATRQMPGSITGEGRVQVAPLTEMGAEIEMLEAEGPKLLHEVKE